MSRAETIIENSKKQIEKLNNTIERHTKRLAKLNEALKKAVSDDEKYWAQCDIRSCEDDIHRRQQDLKDTEKKLLTWQEKLDKEKLHTEWFSKYDFTLLDTWLEQSKQARIEYTDKISRFHRIYIKALSEANETKHIMEETVELTNYMFVNGAYVSVPQRKKIEVTLVEIGDNIYKDHYKYYPGEFKYLSEMGCGVVTKRDYQLSTEYSKSQRESILEREKQLKKQDIILLVEHICTRELTGIKEVGNELQILGSNGKIARMWATTSGGYNIQCLHTRVYVRELLKGVSC